MHILLFPSQVKVGRFRDRLQFHHQPGTSSEAGWFHFALTTYANLILSMEQRIRIELPGLYTDVGLAARMHSHRLISRTNG